jgi:hypothetical protein
MHIELVALEISNSIINDRCAPYVLRWLRERRLTTTLDSTLRPGVFPPNAVRVSTSIDDVRAARGAGYGLVIAIARTDEARKEAALAGADVVLAGFAGVPGALLAVMRSPRRLAPASGFAPVS